MVLVRPLLNGGPWGGQMTGGAGSSVPVVLVAGFETGFPFVQPVLADAGCRVTWLPEHYVGPSEPQSVDCVLFLVEPDTWSSSQLYGLFTAIEHRVSAPHYFLVLIKPCRRDGLMPSVRTTTEIHLGDLQRVLVQVLKLGGAG